MRPGFAVNDDNAALIAEICLRLDGLPLAIELAAARLNVFSPADLLERLRSRLDVLGAGGRDLPERQRTLWGAIAWSYELLNEEERDVFELLSVFSSTGLAAIEAVAGRVGIRTVVDPLAALVDKSLIRSDPTGGSQRFSMLLMIKEYAEALFAEKPEREALVRRAHALYFCAFAEQLKGRLGGPERAAALAELATDIGNLRTSWRYWVDHNDLPQLFRLIDALWTLHEAKGWYHAAIELATDTLEVLGRAEPSPELAAEELSLRTSLARAVMAVRGYGVEVEEGFKRVLEMSSDGGPASQRFPVMRALATYYINLGDFARAAEMGRQLLELGKREGDNSVEAEAHYVLGAAVAFNGDTDTGLAHLDRAIALYQPQRQGPNRFRLGPSPGVLARVASGLILWQGGKIGTGIGRVEAALKFAHEIDHAYSVAYALYHNGYLALGRRRFDDALGRAQQLAALAGENEYQMWKTLATVLEGVSLTALGQPEEGLALTEVGIEIYQELSAPPIFWPLVLNLRASAHALAGFPQRALELIDEAISFAPDPSFPDPELSISKGDFLMMLPVPDASGAAEVYLAAASNAVVRGERLPELRARNRLVRNRRARGIQPDGAAELAETLATFTDGFDEIDLLETKSLLGTR